HHLPVDTLSLHDALPIWLRQVVIGSSIDALDPLGPGAACGEHENRHGAPGRPPPLQHGEAVDFRQPEIQDDEVVVLRIATEPRVDRKSTRLNSSHVKISY